MTIPKGASAMLGIPTGALVAVAIVVATGLVAGCGGSSSKPVTTGSTTTGSTTTGSTTVPHKTHKTVEGSAQFSAGNIPGLGAGLIDARRRTVYVLTKDGHTNAPCTDESGCTDVWPDLPLKGGAKPKAGPGITASLLGTKKSSDGETYPTYNGWLMYEYTGDPGPDQANGQGITSFGGTWYVLSPSGDPLTTGG